MIEEKNGKRVIVSLVPCPAAPLYREKPHILSTSISKM